MTLTPCADHFVLVVNGPRLTLVPARRSDALRAWLHRRSLDRRLGDGAAAESDRLLAVRAHQLVRRSRRRLAASWRAVAAAAPQCGDLWRVVELLGGEAVSARAVANATTALPAVTRAVRARVGGVDVAAAAARAVLTAA